MSNFLTWFLIVAIAVPLFLLVVWDLRQGSHMRRSPTDECRRGKEWKG